MEFTEEDILSELSKPLPVNGVYLGETIAERLGVPRTNPTTDDYLKFYKKLDFCIKGGLVEFPHEWNKKDYQTWHNNMEPRSFYMNYLASREIEITTQGKLYLAQMKASKTKEGGIEIASNNNPKILSDNKVQTGLVNIIADFKNPKFSLFGKKRTKGQKEVGVALIIIEILAYGALAQHNILPGLLVYVAVGAIFITGIIFFGADNLLKNMQNS